MANSLLNNSIAGNITGNIGNVINNTITTANNTVKSIKQNLGLLFERPLEPLFMPKGGNGTVFDLPNNFLPPQFQNLFQEITNQFTQLTQNKISLKTITPPDITIPLRLDRHEQFTVFLPDHAEMAARLIDILMEPSTLDDFQSTAVYCRDQLNPYLYNYALSVAMLHRPDTRDIAIPSVASTFPDKYFNSSIFTRAREQLAILPTGARNPIVIPRDNTGSNIDPEHRVAYFREDLGINLHHWHWHLVYPFQSNNRAIVEKDRRGELFFYMHRQLLARYNAERFSNGLPLTVAFDDLNQPIAEGYFPKLDSTVASRSYPPRFANVRLSNVNRPNVNIEVQNFFTWRDTVREAIEQGFVVDANQNRIELSEERGIDVLGNILESSILNPNAAMYGNIHNAGHLLIAYVHDPENRYLEGIGIMGDAGTAMRDPVFYRWHTFIDQIFSLHKARLPSYTVERLAFPGITVSGVQIQVPNGQPNQLQTFWEQSDMDMSRGMDFGRSEPVFVRFTHLQHREFSYRIQVNNGTRNQVNGTVRIFMAPRNNEAGVRLNFEQQRPMMIELDRFRVGLRPGMNTINRQSTESSVTIPYERTFRNLNANRPAPDAPEEAQFNFCGCGWPQHMLLPRGTEQGMPMDLVVMVSNYVNDRVVQDLVGTCNDADSYCGVNQRRYPDRQSMGYPFDRTARAGVRELNDFLTPNMIVQQVTITHTDRTTLRANN